MSCSTRSDPSVADKRYIPEESTLSPKDFSGESLMTVSFPPVAEEAVGQISLKKVKSSISASVSEKDRETIVSAAQDFCSSETGSGFPRETENSIKEVTNIEEIFPGDVSVSEMGSEVAKKSENFGEEAVKMKEMNSRNVSLSEAGSGFSEESENFGDEVDKRDEADKTLSFSGTADGTDYAFPEMQTFYGCDGEKEENSVLSGKDNLNFEKKGKETEVKRCLEAEKKRLLDELEVGTIFKANLEGASSPEFFKIDKDGNDCQEQQKTMEKRRIKNNYLYPNHAFVGGSLTVEVIDDTALIDAVPIYNKGNDHLPKRLETARAAKDAARNHKSIGEKLVDGKQAKQTRRKGKGNAAKIVEGNNNSNRVSESHNLRQNNGNQLKIMYSRKQMEAMRFAKILDQRKLWRDIYTGLAPEVLTEYEGLACLKDQKNPLSNCGRRQSILRTDRAICILGENLGDEIGNNELEKGSRDNVTGEDYVVEEDYAEDDDSGDDYDSILKPAFAVEGEPDFDSGPPEDGLEYLRRVRWEAKQIPNVNVAKMDRSKYTEKEQSVYMPQIPEIARCPEHLLPLKEWEDAFLSDFSNLRLALSQLDLSSNSGSGKSLPLFISEDKIIPTQLAEDLLVERFNSLNTDEIQANREDSSGLPVTKPTQKEEIVLLDTNPRPRTATVGEYPTLSALRRMDSVTRVAMLRKRICLVETMSTLERRDCAWLFALCAAVDTPLDADTCASLRGLLRKCASIRAEKSEVDDEVIMANILATIAGRYFGQMDS